MVDPVLNNQYRVLSYKHGSWGRKEVDEIIVSDGDWHNPGTEEAS